MAAPRRLAAPTRFLFTFGKARNHALDFGISEDFK